MARKYLIYWGLISFLLLASCNKTDKNYSNISKYLNIKDIDIKNGYKKIVVITDEGCMACTNFLSMEMLGELDEKHTLFVVTSKNSHTIEPFLQKNDNLIVDWQMDINKYPEFAKSSVIFLGENKVDTVINISANEIQEQLNFIKKH